MLAATCPECGRKVFGADTSCPGCGLPRKRIWFCQKCGRSAIDTAATCTACGASVLGPIPPRRRSTPSGSSSGRPRTRPHARPRESYPALRVLAPVAKTLAVLTGIATIVALSVTLRMDLWFRDGVPSRGVIATVVSVIYGGGQAIVLYAIGEAAGLLLNLDESTNELLVSSRKGTSPAE